MNEIRSEAFVAGYCAGAALLLLHSDGPKALWLRVVLWVLVAALGVFSYRKAGKLERRLWERATRRS